MCHHLEALPRYIKIPLIRRNCRWTAVSKVINIVLVILPFFTTTRHIEFMYRCTKLISF